MADFSNILKTILVLLRGDKTHLDKTLAEAEQSSAQAGTKAGQGFARGFSRGATTDLDSAKDRLKQKLAEATGRSPTGAEAFAGLQTGAKDAAAGVTASLGQIGTAYDTAVRRFSGSRRDNLGSFFDTLRQRNLGQPLVSAFDMAEKRLSRGFIPQLERLLQTLGRVRTELGALEAPTDGGRSGRLADFYRVGRRPLPSVSPATTTEGISTQRASRLDELQTQREIVEQRFRNEELDRLRQARPETLARPAAPSPMEAVVRRMEGAGGRDRRTALEDATRRIQAAQLADISALPQYVSPIETLANLARSRQTPATRLPVESPILATAREAAAESERRQARNESIRRFQEQEQAKRQRQRDLDAGYGMLGQARVRPPEPPQEEFLTPLGFARNLLSRRRRGGEEPFTFVGTRQDQDVEIQRLMNERVGRVKSPTGGMTSGSSLTEMGFRPGDTMAGFTKRLADTPGVTSDAVTSMTRDIAGKFGGPEALDARLAAINKLLPATKELTKAETQLASAFKGTGTSMFVQFGIWFELQKILQTVIQLSQEAAKQQVGLNIALRANDSKTGIAQLQKVNEELETMAVNREQIAKSGRTFFQELTTNPLKFINPVNQLRLAIPGAQAAGGYLGLYRQAALETIGGAEMPEDQKKKIQERILAATRFEQITAQIKLRIEVEELDIAFLKNVQQEMTRRLDREGFAKVTLEINKKSAEKFTKEFNDLVRKEKEEIANLVTADVSSEAINEARKTFETQKDAMTARRRNEVQAASKETDQMQRQDQSRRAELDKATATSRLSLIEQVAEAERKRAEEVAEREGRVVEDTHTFYEMRKELARQSTEEEIRTIKASDLFDTEEIQKRVQAARIDGAAKLAKIEDEQSVALTKNAETRIKLDDATFAHRKALNQTSYEEERARLSKIAEDRSTIEVGGRGVPTRTLEERRRANEDLYRLDETLAAQRMAIARAAEQVTLRDEIAFLAQRISKLKEGNAQRLQLEEEYYNKVKQLRDSSESAAAGIIGKVRERLSALGFDNVAADLQTVKNIYSTIRAEQEDTIAFAGQRGRVDLKTLQEAYGERGGERNINMLGGLDAVFGTAGQSFSGPVSQFGSSVTTFQSAVGQFAGLAAGGGRGPTTGGGGGGTTPGGGGPGGAWPGMAAGGPGGGMPFTSGGAAYASGYGLLARAPGGGGGLGSPGLANTGAPGGTTISAVGPLGSFSARPNVSSGGGGGGGRYSGPGAPYFGPGAPFFSQYEPRSGAASGNRTHQLLPGRLGTMMAGTPGLVVPGMEPRSRFAGMSPGEISAITAGEATRGAVGGRTSLVGASPEQIAALTAGEAARGATFGPTSFAGMSPSEIAGITAGEFARANPSPPSPSPTMPDRPEGSTSITFPTGVDLGSDGQERVREGRTITDAGSDRGFRGGPITPPMEGARLPGSVGAPAEYTGDQLRRRMSEMEGGSAGFGGKAASEIEGAVNDAKRIVDNAAASAGTVLGDKFRESLLNDLSRDVITHLRKKLFTDQGR